MPKHSPAPWHVGGRDNMIVYRADGYAVANAIVFHGKDDESSQANAMLMAASPDLLDALENLLACAALNEDSIEEADSDLCAAAHTAIAKAKGIV